MNDERWTELKDKVSSKFGSFEENKTSDFIEDDLGNKIPQQTEQIDFYSPMGKLRIERVTHPKIIDKKSHYHKGSGGASLEFITDPEEFSHKVSVYKEEDGEWKPFDLPPERINF